MAQDQIRPRVDGVMGVFKLIRGHFGLGKVDAPVHGDHHEIGLLLRVADIGEHFRLVLPVGKAVDPAGGAGLIVLDLFVEGVAPGGVHTGPCLLGPVILGQDGTVSQKGDPGAAPLHNGIAAGVLFALSRSDDGQPRVPQAADGVEEMGPAIVQCVVGGEGDQVEARPLHPRRHVRIRGTGHPRLCRHKGVQVGDRLVNEHRFQLAEGDVRPAQQRGHVAVQGIVILPAGNVVSRGQQGNVGMFSHRTSSLTAPARSG